MTPKCTKGREKPLFDHCNFLCCWGRQVEATVSMWQGTSESTKSQMTPKCTKGREKPLFDHCNFLCCWGRQVEATVSMWQGTSESTKSQMTPKCTKGRGGQTQHMHAKPWHRFTKHQGFLHVLGPNQGSDASSPYLGYAKLTWHIQGLIAMSSQKHCVSKPGISHFYHNKNHAHWKHKKMTKLLTFFNYCIGNFWKLSKNNKYIYIYMWIYFAPAAARV